MQTGKKESQVLWWLSLAGYRKDVPWWSSIGEVPGLARTPHMLRIPIAPHFSNHREVSNSGITLTPLYPFPVPRLNNPSSLLPEGFISLVNIAAAHYPLPIPARSQPESSCWTVAFVLFLFVLNRGKNQGYWSNISRGNGHCLLNFDVIN